MARAFKSYLIITTWLAWNAAQAQPPPSDMPAVLLNSPINATWAANHGRYWTDKGFGGFLLSGIQDHLESDVWAVDGDPATTEADDLLLLEVRLANERLIEQGIDRNFVVVPIAPDDHYFCDAAVARRAVARFKRVGVFCKRAGLRGIAIDTRPASLFYDFRWDGYRYGAYTAAQLAEGARAFGQRIVRAFLGECPASDLLVITDGYRYWGSLWFALLEGMLEGVDTSRDAQLHVLTRATCLETAPARIRAVAERIPRILRRHVDRNTWERWQERGHVALGMGPLGYRDAAGTRTPVAAYTFDAYRRQLAAAKLYSDHYVWVEGNGPSWWRLTATEAQTYGRLLQNGAAVAVQTQPVIGNLEAYDVRSPFDDLLRVGPYRSNDGPAYVFLSEQGAALFLSDGIQQNLQIEDLGASLVLTLLVSGARREIEIRDGRLTLAPCADPVLIEPLPVRQWVVPTALWLEQPDPPTSPSASVLTRFGFANRTAFDLAGSLEALPPEGFSIRPAVQPFDLSPGQGLRVDGIMRGRFDANTTIKTRLRIAASGSASAVTRTFQCDVARRLKWRTALDGVVQAAPTIADVDGVAPREVLVCSDAGEVACLNADGTCRWKRRFRGRFDVPAAVGRGAFGERAIALIDAHGVLRVLRHDGRVAWERPFEVRCGPSGPLFADLHPFQGDEIIVGLGDGRVVALRADAEILWSYDAESAPAFLSVHRRKADGDHHILLACTDRSGTVACIGRDGRCLWREAIGGALVSPPVVADIEADGADEVIVATATGGIHVLDAKTAASRSHANLGVAVQSFTVAHFPAGREPHFLITNPGALYCLSRTFDVEWSVELHAVGAPAVARLAAGPCILVATSTGQVVALSTDGAVLWRETRAPVPLAGSPVVSDVDHDGDLECVYASTDRLLEAIPLGAANSR